MITNIKATNAIFLGDKQENEEQRPFKARFLQAGLVKYDFGVCLLKKETIDRFINTFINCPVIIDHKDNLTEEDRKGTIKNIWFSPEDGWFWCDGVLSDEAAELVENGYNVSCQYRITEYTNNFEHKLHNGNEYDKEILNGIFEHLAIVKTPRYEDAYIAVNAIVIEDKKEDKTAANSFTADFADYAYNMLSEGLNDCLGELIAVNFDENKINRDEQGRFAEKGESTSFKDKILKIKPIQINKDDIPHFETKKELSDWVKSEFEKLGSVKIKDTGIDLKLSSTTANRETSKRRAYKEENKAVFVKFEEIVSTAIKKDERKADDRHIKDQEIYYNKFQIGGVDYDVEIFVDKPASGDKNSYYAGHKATKIKITPRDSQVAENSFNLHSKGANIIIPLLEINLNLM